MKRLLLTLIAALGLWVGTVGTIVTPEVVIVDPTADLQDAVDNLDATAGGEIRLGPGTYTVTEPLVLDRPVKLVGAGVSATYIYCADPDSDIVRVTSSDVVIRDLTILGPGEAGSGVGLKLKAAVGEVMRNFDAYNLQIYSTGSWCCTIFGPGWMDTTLAGSYSGDQVTPTFSRVTFYNNYSGGTMYAGHGVAAPRFRSCNFTGRAFTVGPADNGTMADSLEAWHWFSMHPAWQSVTDSIVLHRGHVYLCAATSALFDDCVFQNVSGETTNDEPVLSIEDCIKTRVVNSYFEVYDSTRAQPMVTMSYAQGFVFDNIFARSGYAAPFYFMHTNSDPSSNCYGTISNFWGRHGDGTQLLSAAEKQRDFVFNTSADGASANPIVISNTEILVEDYTGSYIRPVDVRQFSGGASFAAQNILLQNTSSRFGFTKVPYDSLATKALNPKPGEMLYAKGGGAAVGSRGGLLLGMDNASLAGVPICPVMADTALRDATWYPTPRAGDRCFILNYYDTNQGVEMIYDGTAWRRLW